MLAISTYPITSKYALRGFYMDRYVIRRAVHFTYVGQSYAIVGSLLPLGILQFESSWIEYQSLRTIGLACSSCRTGHYPIPPTKFRLGLASRSGQGRFPLFNGRFPWSVRPESESSQEDMVLEAFNCISLCVGTSERISRILL
ncbi:hypothetical protein VNO77_27156 [Canavalia gladiata]|uniref:Uncharacterized protein n=1 Tax=Canavalia gladiata TaxID=3824 RepID=A0AAN9Q681_CANGL